MNDLINRQDALEAICTWDKFGVDGRGRVVWWHEGLEPYVHLRDVVRAIENMPSVQPEITLESAIDYLHSIGWMQEHDRIMAESAPVVHAHWKDAVQGCHDSPHVICSACGGYFWQYFKTFRYCPNCGAKMDEGASV